MAIGCIHLFEDDAPTAEISNALLPRYAWITIRAGVNVCVYLPTGPSSSTMARGIAAELLKAADTFDALQASPLTGDADAEAECSRVAHAPAVSS